MTEILKEWLAKRLEERINWNANDFGDIMKNGHIIAKLLLSYHVIDKNKYDLMKTNTEFEDVKSNWSYLSQWLRDVNISMNDSDLMHIQDGKSSTLLRLFYQLFLNLDHRDRTNFIKRERKMASYLVNKPETRFKVEEIEEPSVEDLSKPLLNEKQFIEWQNKKAAKDQQTYDFFKNKYLKETTHIEDTTTLLTHKISKVKTLSSKEKTAMDIFDSKCPFQLKDYSYEQLLELIKKAEENKPDDILNFHWARNYIKQLQAKCQKHSVTEEFQNEMGNIISESLWNHSIDGEEKKLDRELAKKVMKLSQFEKQMCSRIMETKQQARNIIRNRIEAEKEFADQREQQFNLYLDNLKEQIHLEVHEIDFEQQRQNVLHRKLYAEKIEKKRKHYYEICYDTLLAITDYACKCAYYRLLMSESEIPERFIHEWKALYFKMQPIFDVLSPMEKILEDQESHEEIDMEMESIINLELDRQQILNESEFHDYYNYVGEWALDALIPNYEPNTEENMHARLGHRILGHVVYNLLEIKYPYPPIRGALGIPNYSCKSILRGLPDRALITSIQMLLNLRKIHVVCLETAIVFCLKKFKSEMMGIIDVDLSFDSFLVVAQSDEDRDMINLMKQEGEPTDSSHSVLNEILSPNIKQTQTPKILPEEDVIISNAAELGMYAYRSLAAGDSLTDHLLSAMLVEYIKNQEDINGFVIVNYPNSYYQAQVLEETFSGQAPPDEEDLKDSEDIYLEENIQKRRKIVKDVNKSMRMSKLVTDPQNKSEEKPFVSFFTSYIYLKKTDDILKEDDIWNLTQDNSEIIDRFYSCLGINYSLYYEVIGKNLLIKICRFIIGDFELPLKSDNELFGEDVLNNLEYPAEEKNNSKLIIFPKTNELVQEEESQTSSIEEQCICDILEENSEELPCESNIEQDAMILPGDENWIYGNLNISESIGVALATVWEEMEKSYVNDIHQLLFAVRLQMNCLVPYARFIRDKIEQIVTMPSNKQNLIVKFQKEYNEFENDWRNIILSKNEWHCRVKELRSELYHICDERKILAENQITTMINDNWTMEELTSMANTYTSCMQAEMTRTTKEEENQLYKQLKSAFLDMHFKNIELDYGNNPLNFIIENNVKEVLIFINGSNQFCNAMINKDLNQISKIASSQKALKDETYSRDTINSETLFKDNALRCIEEWTMGVNGEMHASCLRISVLQNKCYRDMKQFNDYLMKTFKNVQTYVDNYYSNEIKAVDRLCQYIQIAIENGQKIPESLILEYDTFVMDPNLLQYAPSVIGTNITQMRGKCTEEFRVGQLARMRDMFRIIAPTGVILKQSFVYLLQDFIMYSKESCNGPVVPEIWKHFDPEKVPNLVQVLFGENVYIDWRDFLIFSLNIKFPNVEELLELRNKFLVDDLQSTELISRDDFVAKELWYERNIGEYPLARLRRSLIKHFLFELFECAPNMMNYSAFFLAFCKSIDPVEGLALAISVITGKKLCFDIECEGVIDELIKKKKYLDECKACALKYSEDILDKIIGDVLDYCEGIIITESECLLESIQSEKENEVRNTKEEIDQVYSNVNVKPTFLCEHCQSEDIIESHISLSKESVSVSKMKSDVIYSVCQSVIWKILKICLPWHFEPAVDMQRLPYSKQIEEVIKELEEDTENDLRSDDEVHEKSMEILNIPDDITTTDETDAVKEVLTNRKRMVVENSSRIIPTSSNHQKLFVDVLELLRLTNAALCHASLSSL
ncbi:Sperm flagellar protein 2 [Eumeta japonica]|uniref:Sperm flagellar protein 2 n=1 Tax=Eumeta variegata TaxID=151549 RepID=A0A4C1UU66_EUMVA|nr:Sperm flagellar protein 2 [Eumeta japonica]